jgi:ParB-like chromosome segregation protein Spo0J
MSTDKIPGGLAKGMSLADIAKHHKLPLKSLETKLKQGIKTEMEHTTDKAVAREIAMDHIYEDPNYYSKLKKIETEGTCGYNQDVETGEIFDTPGGLGEGDKRGLDMYALELQKGLEEAILDGLLNEKDPKTGTGKKPKGSSRRLYTDEDPSDTVGVKFSTKQDIIDTLSKASFKSKSHARQSQIINLIHQRVRAAYERAKDPDVKRRLKTALDYAEQRKEASKEKTQRLKQLKEADGGVDTSWTSIDNETITLQDILELTKDIKTQNFPTKELASIVLNWDNNPEEIERISQVEVSSQYPILIMVDEQGKIQWILDGNHRAKKALSAKAETIPAKLIKPSNLNSKAKKILLGIVDERLKQLKEIGDASAQIFDYDKNQIKTAVNKVMQDVEREKSNDDYSDVYEYPLTTFKSPNAEYNVFIGNAVIPWKYSTPKNITGEIKKQVQDIIKEKKWDKLLRRIILQFGFSANKSEKRTNFNEQFKVLSTVTDILKEFIKEIDKFDNILPEIHIYPKADEIENPLDSTDWVFDNGGQDTNSQRGKFYKKYLEKNLSNLPGNWEFSSSTKKFSLYNADKEKKYTEKFEKEFANDLNETKGSAVPYGSGYKKYIPEITKFMVDKGMNIKPLPVVKFIEDDEENAQDVLGRTAFYNQNDKSISLYTLGRHPKDILRSFCHEMVHHMQNVEGRLPKFYTTNTQEDSALNDIEDEAHKLGSMTMREFEDTIKK